MRVGRLLLRKGREALLILLVLGIVVSLLPVIVSRDNFALCPCQEYPKAVEKIVSRPRRDAIVDYKRSDAAVKSPKIPRRYVDDSPESRNTKGDSVKAVEVPPSILPALDVKKTSNLGREKNIENKADLPAEKKTSNKSVICHEVDLNGNAVDDGRLNSLAKGGGVEKASSLEKNLLFQHRSLDKNVTDESGHQPSIEAAPTACPESAVETVIQSLLHGTVDKLQLRNLHLLTQLEWFGDDALVKKNPAVFVVNKTRSPYKPVPPLLQGQENGCGNDPPFLLVFLPSVASHTTTRQAIRDTWAGPAYGKPWPLGVAITQKMKVVFVFGRTNDKETAQLSQEQTKHNDIVRADFEDTYQNLTIKMLVALNWAATFCPGAKFVMKVDEDTFLNVPMMIDLLTLVSSRHDRFVMGYRNRLPVALRYGKWKVEKKDYPLSHFPPYVIGHSYVITGSVIKNMTEIAPYVPIVPIEDAYVTGIMAAILDIPRVHVRNFAETERRLNICETGRYLSQTRFSGSSLTFFWKYVTAGKCGAWP